MISLIGLFSSRRKVEAGQFLTECLGDQSGCMICGSAGLNVRPEQIRLSVRRMDAENQDGSYQHRKKNLNKSKALASPHIVFADNAHINDQSP
jgi:hypothetical protein